MDEKLKIRNYRKFFRYEKRIYHIGNFRLPVPLLLVDAGYFMAGIGFMWLLKGLLPIAGELPIPVQYAIFPFLFMKFFRTVKLDEKNPFFYLIDMARYAIFEKGQYLESCRLYPVTASKIRIKWNMSRGVSERGGDGYV